MEKPLILFSCTALTSMWGLWNRRNSLLFHPDYNITSSPKDIDVPYKNIDLQTSTGNVNGWFMKGNGNKLLIFSHGNAGNMSHRLPFIEFWRDNLSNTYSLFMYDYPAFGNSFLIKREDGPCVASCKSSLKEIISYFMKDYFPKDITLYGESIGGAITACVAAELVDKYVFNKIILQSTFTSIAGMASTIHKVAGMVVSLLPEELDVTKACRILHDKRVNLLIMHSRSDEIVPYAMFQKLIPFAKRVYILRGSHNETVFDDNVAREILM